MPKRIAILECDAPLPDVAAKYGSYGDIFQSLLTRGDSESNDLEISKWDVVNEMEYPDLTNVDAVLLSGSKHNAFEDKPWILKLVAFVRHALAFEQIKVFAICFGHQIVARALGQKVGKNDAGWELAVDKVTLTEQGQILFRKKSLSLHQMHRDIVLDVPPGVTNLGYSERCGVQGLYKPGRLLSIQAHPEFNGDIMSTILAARYQQKILTETEYSDANERACIQHDGAQVADIMLEMLTNA
ncbi:hypothetical protein KCU61_g9633, partial [Aureobasidium melanogenum]